MVAANMPLEIYALSKDLVHVHKISILYML